MEKYLKGKWNSDFSFPFNLFNYLTVSLFIYFPLTALGKKTILQLHQSAQKINQNLTICIKDVSVE